MYHILPIACSGLLYAHVWLHGQLMSLYLFRVTQPTRRKTGEGREEATIDTPELYLRWKIKEIKIQPTAFQRFIVL